ncbi:protein involved in cell division [Lachnospiraceae bacterium JC7]|nr:protein involved in cell division [Lachnospiraceae bacterium JC7]
MDDIKKDPFEEYLRHTEPSRKELGYAWYTAMGLQAVDGLETSEHLKGIAKDNIDGKITLSEANKLIETYYEESLDRDSDRTREADTVTGRIAAVLSENAFTFSVPQYIGIHKRLFTGIFSHAGKIRDYNISKREWVLDGASVHYGNAFELRELLDYDLRMEKEYEYPLDGVSEMIPHLAKFVARLWQIHAFGEGNTRTTAVFFIKYLISLGFNVTNDLFAKNSWYFRNALVRANYNDYTKDIRETTEYLELFLRNLLMGESNELKNRYLHVRWNTIKQDIDNPKQDIEEVKQDIEEVKQDIGLHIELSAKTKQHIEVLFTEFGYEKYFGRMDVMEILGITASPASTLIKKCWIWN